MLKEGLMTDQEEIGGTASTVDSGDCGGPSVYGNCEFQQLKGLQPELFFKMSHEIYNYGEGLIGKVAADHSHKWIYKDPSEQEINFLSAWHNAGDTTIALIAVREGVLQLGAVHKVLSLVMEDLSYIVLLRKKFNYLESIPGVLLPHPSSSAFTFRPDGCSTSSDAWPYHPSLAQPSPMEYYNNYGQPLKITPSMSSLEALLSKLPAVVPPTPTSSSSQQFMSSPRPLELMGMGKVAKEEMDDDYDHGRDMDIFRLHCPFLPQGCGAEVERKDAAAASTKGASGSAMFIADGPPYHQFAHSLRTVRKDIRQKQKEAASLMKSLPMGEPKLLLGRLQLKLGVAD
ncbi:hypothetical protein Scep_021451 [Stephania cephalantha]|uniref:Transcription factor MYC/MYB N-terminal domain-containing protein n=1 Tax=Stephania cephalantha TaxID=152367 RepID=A0AAP0I087_9MAGN